MFRNTVVLAAILIVISISAVSFAQQQVEPTGNRYRVLSSDYRLGYLMGYVHGVSVGSTPGINVQRFEDCTEGRSFRQMMAILEKYLADNPGEWHRSMITIIPDALVDACR